MAREACSVLCTVHDLRKCSSAPERHRGPRGSRSGRGPGSSPPLSWACPAWGRSVRLHPYGTAPPPSWGLTPTAPTPFPSTGASPRWHPPPTTPHPTPILGPLPDGCTPRPSPRSVAQAQTHLRHTPLQHRGLWGTHHFASFAGADFFSCTSWDPRGFMRTESVFHSTRPSGPQKTAFSSVSVETLKSSLFHFG